MKILLLISLWLGILVFTSQALVEQSLIVKLAFFLLSIAVNVLAVEA